MKELEIGQYVKVTLPDELKTTGKYAPPYYSGIGELVDIQIWNDNIVRYCVTFPDKGSVWFPGDVIAPSEYAGMTHTIKYQLAHISS